MTLGVIGVVVIIAARVAEPSVRPVLYPVSVSPATTVVPVLAETSAGTVPATTTTTTAAPSTTTTVPVAATTTTTTTTTTTAAPVDELAVLTAPYTWGPSVDTVLLQEVLGVSADGWYGPATREAHLAENESRGLSVEGVPAPPTTAAPATTTTMVVPATTVVSTTTATPATTVVPTTTATPATTTTTVVPTTTTTTVVPTTTVSPPSTTVGMFGNLGAQLVAQLLGQPCIADGDLSDCGPEVSALIQGLVG
jgi:hypothetical protein